MKAAVGKKVGLALVLAAMAAQASAQVIKIATLSPDGSGWMTSMRAGADEIRNRTQGRVEFKFYTGGVMGATDRAVLSKMKIGQLQGGAVTAGSLTEYAKDVQVYSVPLKFKNFEEVDYVRSHMDAKLSHMLEEAGMVNFGFAEGGFAYAMSKNQPVPSVEALRQEKVWIPDNDHESEVALQAFGVTPVPLALPDVLTSLHTGIVNAVAFSPIATLALQWHTEVKYLTELPIEYFVGTLAIDKKVFERLSPADQGVVREVMTREFKQIDAQNRKDNVAAYAALLKQGIKPVKPSPQELQEWLHYGDLASQRILGSGVLSPQIIGELDGDLKAYRAGQK
jgi:TRAP-type C4-dicarboxylate transport system substrate-binding protein